LCTTGGVLASPGNIFTSENASPSANVYSIFLICAAGFLSMFSFYGNGFNLQCTCDASISPMFMFTTISRKKSPYGAILNYIPDPNPPPDAEFTYQYSYAIGTYGFSLHLNGM